jgi:hypothetical protein
MMLVLVVTVTLCILQIQMDGAHAAQMLQTQSQISLKLKIKIARFTRHYQMSFHYTKVVILTLQVQTKRLWQLMILMNSFTIEFPKSEILIGCMTVRPKVEPCSLKMMDKFFLILEMVKGSGKFRIQLQSKQRLVNLLILWYLIWLI